MKTKLIVLVLLTSLYTSVLAQSPNKFKYQAILRNAQGIELTNKNVKISIDILKDKENGEIIFSEEHKVTTNEQGLISIQIGSINDLSKINWINTKYFISIKVDEKLLGISELVSVPFALYANTVNTVQSIDVNSIENSNYFDKWDKDASDDFDGDYNSLINKPTTITTEEKTKLNYITITQNTNLDALKANVDLNTAKVSFPGFGFTQGKALEGNTELWSKLGNNLIYNKGAVGINVNENTNFGGASLMVGGGIVFKNTPNQKEAGALYYDASGEGSFKYVNNNGTETELIGGSIENEGNVIEQNLGVANLNANLNIQFSLGIGTDIVNNENYGFNTLKLKENNLRILFDDSDDINSGLPANDWQIEINDSKNGGESYFGIKDITHSTFPFKIMAAAPDNAFIINSEGKIGINTDSPDEKLVVNGNIKATAFIGDGSKLTGLTGGIGGISEADNITIEADTDNNNTGDISFLVGKKLAMNIANNGNVAIGKAIPETNLDVNGDIKADSIKTNKIYYSSIIVKSHTNYFAGDISGFIDVTNKSLVSYPSGIFGTIKGLKGGVAGQELTLSFTQIDPTKELKILNNSGEEQSILLPKAENITAINTITLKLIFDGENWLCTYKNAF